MDKHKDNGILHGKLMDVQYCREVVIMVENSPELLNSIYRELSEHLGMETTLEIYRMFKGQQISFPVRFFNPAVIQKKIVLSGYLVFISSARALTSNRFAECNGSPPEKVIPDI